MSCGGSRATNANAAVIADLVSSLDGQRTRQQIARRFHALSAEARTRLEGEFEAAHGRRPHREEAKGLTQAAHAEVRRILPAAVAADLQGEQGSAVPAARPRVKKVPLSEEAVGPVYQELRGMLPEGSRFGLIVYPDRLHLELIEVAVRGQGHGERVLSRLCQIADTNRWPLSLEVSTEFGSDRDRLHTWYARHGFAGEGRKMHRSPRRVTAAR